MTSHHFLLLAGLFASFAILPIFGWFKRPKAKVDPGLAPMNPNQFDLFERSLKAYFNSRGQSIEICGAELVVSASAGEKPMTYGLSNLAQNCCAAAPERWDAIIATHFQKILDSKSELDNLNQKLESFDDVKASICIRLYPPNFIAELGADAIMHRVDLEGTVTCLVFDLPSIMRTIRRDETAKWNLSQDQLFAHAIENLPSLCPAQPEKVSIADGLSVYLIGGDSFLTSSYALRLGDFPQCIGTHGSLVAVPHRHAIICYPIEDMDVIQVTQQMLLIAEKMENEGPGSISPHVYYRRPNGTFLLLPHEQQDDKIIFSPPDEFVELLNRLAEKQGPPR
jgi:hypothetical protein